MIRVRDLSMRFSGSEPGPVAALRGISLDLAPGERVGLVGESGSGKSLTALACLGVAPVSAEVVGGRVELGGDDARRMTPSSLRRWRGGQVGLALQEAADALNPVYSIGFQLREAIRAHRPVGRRESHEIAHGLLAAVALEPPERIAGAYPHQLSGGQAQRVMLAIALAGEPRILIADEPTSGLDPVTRCEVLGLVGRLVASRGLGLLLISHDLAVVRDAVERVLVMYAGQVVEEGSVDDIFSAPLHPCTRELMDAANRRIDAAGGPERRFEAWRPPASAAGCSYRSRCPLARPQCGLRPPDLQHVGPDRRLRCPVVAEDGEEATGA